MAILSGVFPVVGSNTSVHSTALNVVGQRSYDIAGNEFIYLQGVGSTVLGSWVTFDELGLTLLAVANGLGRVAIAGAATVASTWGWYQVYGLASGLCLALFADNGHVWLTSTPGSVDDADVAVDVVQGAVGRSARNTTTGLATFELNYPFCPNEVQN